MTKRWPAALSDNIIDDSAVNAFAIREQLQGENSSKFSKKKVRNFLIQLGKKLARLRALSSTSTRQVTPQQNKRKRTEV